MKKDKIKIEDTGSLVWGLEVPKTNLKIRNELLSFGAFNSYSRNRRNKKITSIITRLYNPFREWICRCFLFWVYR